MDHVRSVLRDRRVALGRVRCKSAPGPTGVVDGGRLVQRTRSVRVVDPQVVHTVCTVTGCDGRGGRYESFFPIMRQPGLSLGLLADAGGQFLDMIEDLTPLGHFGTDLLRGVHDGGVIPAERLPDSG